MSPRKYECEVCRERFPKHHLLQFHRNKKHSKPWVETRSLPGGGLPPRIAAPRIPPPRIPALRKQPGGPGTAPTMLGSASPLSVSSRSLPGGDLPPRIAAPTIPPPRIPALREQPGGPGTAPTMLGSASRLSVSSGAGTGPAPQGLMGGPSFLGRGEQMHPLPPMIRNDPSAQFTGSIRSIALPGNFDKYYIEWVRAAAALESSLNHPVPGHFSRFYQRMVEHWESQGIDPLTMSPKGPMSQPSNSNTVTSITSNNLVGATTASLPAGRTLSQGNQSVHDAAVRSSLDQLTVEVGLRNQKGSIDASGQQLCESRGTGPGPSHSSDK